MRRNQSPIAAILARREITLLVIIVVLVAAVGIRAPRFLQPARQLSILNDTIILLMLTLGQLAVILTAGIDLSVASNLAFTGMAVAMWNMVMPGVPMVVLVGASILIGASLGAFNGVMVSVGKVPPIIMTLGTMSVYRGMVFLISGGAWVSAHQMSESFRGFARFNILGLPSLVWIGVITTALVYVFLRFTRSGRELYAVGDNATAAGFVGVSARKAQFKAFVLSGAIAGLTGLLWVSRFASAQNDTAIGFELETVAAAVIGGVSIMGGSGTVTGVVLGAVFLGIVKNALTVVGVSPFWQMAIQGAVILVAIVANTVVDRRNQARLSARRISA